MDTNWTPELPPSTAPKYRALADALRHDVRAGRLRAGDRLPPVRDLAWRLKVTPGTVARAYQIATDAGLLEATVGRGTFVRAAAPDTGESTRLLPPEMPGVLDMLASRAVDVGQSAAIGALVAEIAGQGVDFIRYATEGQDLMPARRAAADWLGTHGIATSAQDLMLTEGAHNGIFGALLMTLTGREPLVLMESLTYPGFRRAVRSCRGRAITVASDADGLIPEAVEDACARHPVQAILLSASAHNPTTARLPMARRLAIAEIARRADVQIIEDDVYGLALPDRLPGFDQLCPERAWVTTSLSKCVAAGLRVGFLTCPPGRGIAAPRTLRGMALGTSLLLARVLERLLVSGQADAIRAAVQVEVAARVARTRSRLGSWDLRTRDGLNYAWLPLPTGWRSSAFAAACERRGILVAGADIFAEAEGTAPNAVRLSLSGPFGLDRLDAALVEIDAVLREAPPVLIA